MTYIYPAPGVTGSESTLKVHHTSSTADSSGLLVPALQDVTVNNANDVFTWQQLDNGSKRNIATTATNSISGNIVLDQTSFFGDGNNSATAASQGVFGLSKNKTKVEFNLYFGDTDTGGAGKRVTGVGFITGLAPSVSADAPVWVSPITITVDGDYTVGDE
tara:strand:- start:13826 stop:14308 length:483 start_codon:yes stop_codon:yes gene_type:complete